MNATESFLQWATPARQADVKMVIRNGDWRDLQTAFLDRMDAYAQAEIARGADHLIAFHEAGGHWRIAFPHLQVRPNPETSAHLGRVMAARQEFVDAHYHRGYPDECEVHHDVETFLYFQIPLFHRGEAGSEAALKSIRTVADHCLNRSADVPPWYDWRTHGFVSTWLGTRRVRNRPPFDYQEANHFRFVDLCTNAYVGCGEPAYLELAEDYAARWCSHIEAQPGDGPIPCQILPKGALVEELGKAGAATREDVYQIFYATAAPNTTYDVAMSLLDLYAITGKVRYLTNFTHLLDPFFVHGQAGRPAHRFSHGAWEQPALGPSAELKDHLSQIGVFFSRMALRHDRLTGTNRYRDAMINWACAIAEEEHAIDQSVCDVLVAAHHYTGDTQWLHRAYAMGLRIWAVCEDNMGAHGGNGANCNATTRYGSEFLLESLYLPLLGVCDWGTRGNLPDPVCRRWLTRHEKEERG